MCGIVGYTGKPGAKDLILKGLQKLEYRGYDSAGVALFSDKGFIIRKIQGNMDTLLAATKDLPNDSSIGIGHTRWATHGKPNERNAHPHTSCDNKVVIVHNGVIENFAEIRHDLKKHGHKFRSETDSEVIAHLIEEGLKSGKDVRAAVAEVTSKLHGSYAFIAGIIGPGGKTMVAARYRSPLIFAQTDDESIFVSDVPAIAGLNAKMYPMDDGDVIIVNGVGVSIWGNGKAKIPQFQPVPTESAEAEKAGFAHFMQKEIYDQPAVVESEVLGRVDTNKNKILLDEIKRAHINWFDRIIITACGTSYHSALYGKYLLEKLAGIPVDVWLSSELIYADVPVNRKTLLVAVSQSGETADTMEAVRRLKKLGVHTFGITNIKHSSLARECDNSIFMRAGLEVGVAASKTYISQLLIFLMLACYCGLKRRTLKKKELHDLISQIILLPDLADRILKTDGRCKEIANAICGQGAAARFMFIGRGPNVATAYEGALKMKEISYLHAEGYAGGEMKHGPLALVDDTLFCVAIAPDGPLFPKLISNVQEISARSGQVIAVTSNPHGFDGKARFTIQIPPMPELLSPIVYAIPLQLLAYHCAVLRGNNPDRPRNLAKSVTVE